MKSMTGYGYREKVSDRYSISVEIKSFNNRYLDIQVSLPHIYSPLEPLVREQVAAAVGRGRVDVICRVRELDDTIQIQVDTKNAKMYAEALKKLAEAAGLPPEISLGHLLRMEGILQTEKVRDMDALWGEMSALLAEVLTAFEETRKEEGKKTAVYLRQQLEEMDTLFAVVRGKADLLESLLSQHLKERFDEIAGKSVDEGRIAAETAILLMKYSIGEEIQRFDGHLASFRDLLDQDNGGSKKLDFICQELNREINTIASKSFLLEVNQAVIGIKDSIEKIREQLRNVE
ncbi:MAG: YicC family protein [Spirochaetales bacterium]|nr:YicC family protein [Spirochaetales bacterium]